MNIFLSFHLNSVCVCVWLCGGGGHANHVIFCYTSISSDLRKLSWRNKEHVIETGRLGEIKKWEKESKEEESIKKGGWERRIEKSGRNIKSGKINWILQICTSSQISKMYSYVYFNIPVKENLNCPMALNMSKVTSSSDFSSFYQFFYFSSLEDIFSWSSSTSFDTGSLGFQITIQNLSQDGL